MNKRTDAVYAVLKNPFPKVPEVTIGLHDQPVTISTKAVRDARTFVDDHIHDGSARSLAIIGDYGMGKSHLANEVRKRIVEREPSAITCIIRASSNDSLTAIYKRIFQQYHVYEKDDAVSSAVRHVDVCRQVTEVYRGMELERYADTHPGSTLEFQGNYQAEITGRSRKFSVADDIELTRALQCRLRSIVEDREFADGLSLLLHDDPDIAGHAWEWLRGGPVTSDIAERGVAEPIEDESRAMIALLVLARLFNNGGARFALIIDDIEHLGSGADAARRNLEPTLNLLFRWAADSQSLLVVAGLIGTWQGLAEGVLQRVGRVIYPAPFTKADIAGYQRQIYRCSATDGPRFTPGAVARIHDVTAGSPRKVVDTFYHAFQRAGGADAVTAQLIDQVGREIFVHTPPSEAAEQIHRFCARLGHRVISGSMREEAVAQLRILAGSDDPPGCLIAVTGSVVDSASASKLVRLTESREDDSAEPGPRVSILVCTGQLAESLQALVRNAFTDVLRFDHDEFWYELSTLIRNLLAPRDTLADATALRELHDDVRSLRAQQAGDHELLQQLAAGREEKLLRAVIRDETRRALLRSPSNADALDFGEKFPEVQAIFDKAVSAIREALERVEQLWRSMFQSQEPTRLIDRSKAPGGRAALPSDLTPDPIIRALGVLVALDNSLDGFGRAVIGLLQDLQGEAAERRARQYLTHQCSRFDTTVENLIVYIPSSDEDANFTVYRVLGIDRGSLLAKLQRLGATVFDTIYSADFEKRP